MLRNLIEYHWAEHIDDVLLLLARLDVKTVPLAGGTSLLASNDERIEAVVDLRDLGLTTLSQDAQNVHIGAMTTLQQIAQHPLLHTFASGILAQSASVSSPSLAIRHSATIGGTLILGANAHADVLTALTALDAQAVMRSGSRTSISLNGGALERSGSVLSGIVYKGKQERLLDCASVSRERLPNELLVDIAVPRLAQESYAAFVRVSETPTSVALLNIALLIEVKQERLSRVRIALGGGDMEPVRCPGFEQLAEGQSLRNIQSSENVTRLVQEGLTTFRPTTDIYASAGYRKAIASHLVRQAFEDICTYRMSGQTAVELESR